MTRSVIHDAALAAAKAWSHPAVEQRHVLYAICRTFQKRPELAPLLAETKAALNPHGSSASSPTVSEAADALLKDCKSEEAAVGVVVRHLQGGVPATANTVAEGKPAVAPALPEPAHSVQPVDVPEGTAAVLAELDALVGLASVKNQVRELIAVVQANDQRRQAGLPVVSSSLHLVFTGSPGTGKTTVARLVARLYAAAGVLKGSRLSEVTRADLVAGYVGQTAIKTQEVVQRTRPGVLFIDEAYSLASRHGSDYSNECVSTLVKCMEDHRSDFAIIAAGYDAEMGEFIESNPGLRSRFKTSITFPDYSPAEMVNIFSGFAKDADIALAPGVLERAERIFGDGAKHPAFGNARFVRSAWEHAYAKMAVRASTDGKIELHELAEIQPDDLPTALPAPAGDRRKIGFG